MKKTLKGSSVETKEIGNDAFSAKAKPSLTSSKTGIEWPLSGGRTMPVKLVKIAASDVRNQTFVYADNEREQSLLNEAALADITATISEGQRVPAVGRKVDGKYEIADGSRRRASCLLAEQDFWLWVGNFSNADMSDLSNVGNAHKQTSEYEKARKLAQRLAVEFEGNKSQAEKALNVSRRSLGRAEKIAMVPVEFVAVYHTVNDLTGRQALLLSEAWKKASEAVRNNALLMVLKINVQPTDSFDDKQASDEITKKILKLLQYKPRKPTKKQTPVPPLEIDSFSGDVKSNRLNGTYAVTLNNIPPELVDELDSEITSAIEKIRHDYMTNRYHIGLSLTMNDDVRDTTILMINDVIETAGNEIPVAVKRHVLVMLDEHQDAINEETINAALAMIMGG